jgi:hypothetical protein
MSKFWIILCLEYRKTQSIVLPCKQRKKLDIENTQVILILKKGKGPYLNRAV